MTDQHPDFVTDEVMEAYIYGKVMRPTTTKKEIMTYQHPLTDEICEQIADTLYHPFTLIERENMRSAADWQLRQVIEWLHNNLYVVEEDGSIRYLDTRNSYGELVAIDRHQIIDDLEAAMRPQEDN